MNNWTPDRPTKPGKYELSIHPDLRSVLPVRLVAVINQDGTINAYGGFGGCWYWDGDEDWLDGALWRPYVEPPDPFAEPVPIEMYRMSDDAKTPNLRLILSVEPGEVVLYEADMTSRSATAKETTVHDKIIMSPADARWLRDALEQADLSDPPEVTR